MTDLLSGNSFQAVSLLVFVAVLLLAEGGWLLWKSHKGPQAKKLQQRLRSLSASGDAAQPARVLRQRMASELPWLERTLLALPRLRGLDAFIAQAGLTWSLTRLLAAMAACGLVAAIALGMLLHPPALYTLVAGLAAATLPLLFVRHRRNARLRLLERQLPEALDLMCRALRAGHAFSSALKMGGEEMPEPMGGELRIVHDEINYGVSLQQGLSHLCERVPLTDLRYFVVAVLTQRESGGNLTEILGKLAHLVRERLKLLARVRVLSSEGRMSAWTLGLMPFALAGLMSVINPDFMRPLWTDPMGQGFLKFMLGSMFVGVLLIRRIIRIRV
ncbi:type II secretion system F family protein [Ramlibacter sp.]|uniref:type II secretion system F family protein n=1 Tax=Ramlibacter sp. TaxID=1917967 RepID=UPI0017C8BB4A|nr:type II secretion system F family protein [Ramlibacter sp.]MBA2676226.1 type II secretion system F family protein [Ramlibacter sp.]